MRFLQRLFKTKPKEHYDIYIKGRVQNVWFRSKARRLAGDLEVKGFIKYEGEDSLYAEVEGKSSAVQSFLEWCQRGPSLANVDSFEAQKSDPKGFSRFSIH